MSQKGFDGGDADPIAGLSLLIRLTSVCPRFTVLSPL